MGMHFGPLFWGLALLGTAAAALYGGYFLNQPHTLLRAGVKTLFMGAFTAAFISAGAPFPFVVALAAAALGDLFLAFDKKWLLPIGILSFLIAQLGYLLIFTALWFFSGDNAPLWPRYMAMVLICAATLGFLIWMAPKLGWMALGVVPYALAITAMTLMAMWQPWVGWPIIVGALSFVVSDFVLATELFRLPPDAPVRRITTPVVWWTYAAAQLLIMWGVVKVVLA